MLSRRQEAVAGNASDAHAAVDASAAYAAC